MKIYLQLISIVIWKYLKKVKYMLKYNCGEKSMKIPFAIYVNTVIIDTFHNNPEKSSTAKGCGYSLFNHCSFDSNEN